MKSFTPYSDEFEQKLIDIGVFTEGLEDANGDTPEPSNFQELCDMLDKDRASLTSTPVMETVASEFIGASRQARSENSVMESVVPIITGSKDKDYFSASNIEFNNLHLFDKDLSKPKPDKYYGAKPANIDTRVRRDLDKYIVPSKRKELPAAPNFFLEGKSAGGRWDVAERQAIYDGANGARGILHLQNYGGPTLLYDNNAYTISAVYHPRGRAIHFFATHPRPSVEEDDRTDYHFTLIDQFPMHRNADAFRKAIAAFRNAREWTKEQRDLFITNANSIVRS